MGRGGAELPVCCTPWTAGRALLAAGISGRRQEVEEKGRCAGRNEGAVGGRAEAPRHERRRAHCPSSDQKVPCAMERKGRSCCMLEEEEGEEGLEQGRCCWRLG
jgi:hypothetical protein